MTLLLVCAVPAATASGPKAPTWAYEGRDGPEYWGTLDASYRTCDEGATQSPLNVKATGTAHMPPVKFRYGVVDPAIVNTGRTIEVDVPEGNTIRTDAGEFKLVRVNFHTPSEYQINGRYYPLDMNFVHRNDKGELAVVGIMIEEGAVNTALEDIFWNAPVKAGEASQTKDMKLDLRRLLPDERSYYRFMGSLTTPPCSEGVNWFVMKTPITASLAQIAKFHERYTLNSRPIQPTNDRVVTMNAE